MIGRAAAFLGLLMMTWPAQAVDRPVNGLVILADDEAANVALVTINGSDNVLMIDQEASVPAETPNRIAVRISGDRNGGVLEKTPAPAPLIEGLGWGSLTQTGTGNMMEIGVAGTDNLFALAQTGTANTVLATIAGTGNQAAVNQVGANNFAAFSQTGRGNMMSITQRSW